LKAVADDLVRPPHALEYVLDYRMGPPSLKYFRCVCALKRRGEWQVLPALSRPRPLEVAQTLAEAKSSLTLSGDALAMLLIYREPWSRAWTIGGATTIEAEDALAHCITWADFQRELDGSEINATIIGGVGESLRSSGLRAAALAEPNFTRSLLPAARQIVRWLRRGN
jgi:hypothetical protein